MLGTGVVCATGIVGCALDGTSLALNQCYSPSTFFTNPLTVNWGAAFGPATFNGSNPQNVTPTSPWMISSPVAGVMIGVNVGTDFSGTGSPALSRVNNEQFVWDPTINAWNFPNSVPTSSPDHADLTYAGHFSAPGPAEVVGSGANLLQVYNGSASYVITFSQGILSAGLLVSIAGSGYN